MDDITINAIASGKTMIMVRGIKTALQNNKSVGVMGIGNQLRIIRMLNNLGVTAEVKPIMKDKKQVGFLFTP